MYPGPARLEVQSLIREIGLIAEADLDDEAFPEIEPGMAGANAETKDMVGVDYSTNILAYSALSRTGVRYAVKRCKNFFGLPRQYESRG